MDETGFDFLKWGLVLAAWPIWAPFAKALWKEFQRAMRPEGGLTGPVPSKGERLRIEEQVAQEELSQVHESFAHHKARLTAGARPGGQQSAGQQSAGRQSAGRQSAGRQSAGRQSAGRQSAGWAGGGTRQQGTRQQGTARRNAGTSAGAPGRAVFRRRGQGSQGPQRPGFR